MSKIKLVNAITGNTLIYGVHELKQIRVITDTTYDINEIVNACYENYIVLIFVDGTEDVVEGNYRIEVMDESSTDSVCAENTI